MASKQAKALLSAGRFREAGELLEREGELKDAVAAYLKGNLWKPAGALWEKMGKPEKAADCYEKGRCHVELGKLYLKSAQYEDAGKEFASSGDNAQAAEAFRLAYEESKDQKLARLAASFYSKAGKARQAAHLYLLIGDHSKAAEALQKDGLFEEAGELLNKHGFHREAAEVFLRAGKFQKAGDMYKDKGENSVAGRLYLQAGNFKMALPILEQAEQWEEAAKAALGIQDWKKAGEYMRKAGKPVDSARAYLHAKLAEEALISLSTIRSSSSDYDEACKLAVDALEIKGDVSYYAETMLAEFLRRNIDDKTVDLVYRLAQLYERTEFWENAEELLKRILAFKSPYKEAIEHLKRVEEIRKDSLALYRKVMKEDFNYEEITDRLARHRERTTAEGGPPQPTQMFNPYQAPWPYPPPGGVPGQVPGPGGAPDPTMHYQPAYPQAPYPPNYPQQMSQYYPPGPPMPQQVPGVPPQQAPGAPPPQAPLATAFTQAVQSPVVVQEGMLLDNRYQIVKRLGSGGMGDVFRARDTKLDEDVAIKVINASNITEDSLAWFKQEVKVTRKLSHPNIIRLHDLREIPGLVFITMEYVDGKDLRSIVEKLPQRRMPLNRGLSIIVQVCDALNLAHDNGVIHRDIKPQNIMITENDRAKVLDFGLAKMANRKGLSKTGLAYGTPHYMSPEQVRGQKTMDHRIDIYALGVVFYEMLTGVLPFDHEEMVQVFLKHLNELPAPPRNVNPEIPPGIEKVILKCLEKDPTLRFNSCLEMRKAIVAAVSTKPHQ